MIAITKDKLGIADSLQQLLAQKGYSAEVFTTLPESASIAALVVLDMLDADINTQQVTDIYINVFQKIKHVAKNFSQNGGLLITVQNTGGYFGLKDPLNFPQSLLSGITGLVKTAAQEWPKANCKAVDIHFTRQSLDKIAKQLCDEVLADNFDDGYLRNAVEVGYPDKNIRIKLSLQPERLNDKNKCMPQKNSVFVVTGGARGITAACLIAMSKKQNFRFALLGRTILTPEPEFCKNLTHPEEIKKALIRHYAKEGSMPTPKKIDQQLKLILSNREIENTISLLENLGSEVMYFPVDAVNFEELNAVIQQIRTRWENIDGIIHGAGVLADKLITEKTVEQFTSVFETKVLALQNLLKLTQQDNLSYICVFSSVAGRFGNIGQADYAAANEVLNKIAQFESRHRKSCWVKSINWAPWESGMVNEVLKKMFLARNIPVLSLAQGTEIFVDEIFHRIKNNDDTEVVYGTLSNHLNIKNNIENNIIYKQFECDITRHSYLNSHVIQGVPVVPACLVLEWFLRTLKSFLAPFSNNNLVLECHQFKVLKGIQLKNIFEKSEYFIVQCEKSSSQKYRLVLCDSDQLVRYKAEFLVKENDNHDEIKINRDNKKMQQWPYRESEIYVSRHVNGVLFHGEAFEAIYQLNEFSKEGGSAKLKTLKHHAWPKEDWKCDVLALDGALQLLLLWTHAELGKPSLPTGFEKVIFFQEKLPDNAVITCEFLSHKMDNYRTKSDMILWLENKKPYAKLLGVEMCVVL